MKEYDCCPHCGGTSGIYTKTTYIDVRYNIGFHGEEQDNGEMYDNVTKFRGGRICYCQDCNKQICKTSDFPFL